MSAEFVLNRAAIGGAIFSYRDSSGRVILVSQRYDTTGAARAGIESIRANCAVDDRYERHMARSGHPYFNLKTADGEIVCTSVMFAAPQERHAAIEEMQRSAAAAPIVTVATRE